MSQPPKGEIDHAAVRKQLEWLAIGSVVTEASAITQSPYNYTTVTLLDEYDEPMRYPHIIVSATAEMGEDEDKGPIIVGLHSDWEAQTAFDSMQIVKTVEDVIPAVAQVMAHYIRTEHLP